MSFTFDPYKLRSKDVEDAKGVPAKDVLMTNPTALSELEQYWSALPRTRGVPMRKDVDPSKMDGLLEDCFILERVALGVARIRVAGRNVTKLLGIEPRGLPLTAAFLPKSRAAMGQHLEAAFTSPGLVELSLISPRAVGQPTLQGKILMLPLRDDHGRVSRMLGVLVMSGRLGNGGRRFEISPDAPIRFEPTLGLHAVDAPVKSTEAQPRMRPNLQVVSRAVGERQKAKDTPALRLVVSNP